MKYYLKHIESIDKFTIACYSNDELLFEKRINQSASNLLILSSYEYELNEIIFGLSCSLHIRKNSDFYFIDNNKKVFTMTFNSFINALKDIINIENRKEVSNNEI